jgi:hypothetical protein
MPVEIGLFRLQRLFYSERAFVSVLEHPSLLHRYGAQCFFCSMSEALSIGNASFYGNGAKGEAGPYLAKVYRYCVSMRVRHVIRSEDFDTGSLRSVMGGIDLFNLSIRISPLGPARFRQIEPRYAGHHFLACGQHEIPGFRLLQHDT